jgi:hypothetical protein
VIITLPDHPFQMDIPDEWWAAGGMSGFVPGRSFYSERSHENATLAMVVLPLTSIWVRARRHGVPNFGRERMISVLEAIRLDKALPPIEVEAKPSGHFTHRLYHGYHRFAASLAVGFTCVPAVIVDYSQV